MIDFSKIEKKWQKIWEKEGIYKISDKVKGLPAQAGKKDNFMLLTEFPYPSGNLHIGHWYAFAVPDILGRYLRMKGKNVSYPIGFDAFGLPAENAAIKRKINPRDWTEQNIKYMTSQLKSMGAAFDWDRAVSTIDPGYYKWTQWIFLKLYEKGLAYRAKTSVNWCPKDKTVLANEQVVSGLCERCDTPVVQKDIEQWMFKTTAYADRLIDDIEGLDWPQTTKLAQKNWIGRSEGALIKFKVILNEAKQSEESKKRSFANAQDDNSIEVFTTRVDTIFGCTYVVIAPEHSLVKNLKFEIKNYNEVDKYIKEANRKSELERMTEDKQKIGVELKGIKAINPFNNEELPVFVADYVLGHYGTGAVMAVPAHDERDWEFAKKYGIKTKTVILRSGSDEESNKAFCEDGILVDSGEFTGMTSEKAREAMTKWLKEKELGGPKKTYKLHDWVLSRQRYWGVPIPMIKCETCVSAGSTLDGYIPVAEKDLPVKLPKLDDFLPTGEGKSPLVKAKKWASVKCPQCGNKAERETDTMDTFVDSSWYFIRYADPKNKKKFADAKKMKNWLPVPMYVGGTEHNTMHLLYSRFFTKALHDLGLIDFNEPFIGRRNHGVILGLDNQKMSKSRGNVVDPDKEVANFGADCVRMYLAFMGPYDQGGPWNPTGILGIKRFLERVYKLFNIRTPDVPNIDKKENKRTSGVQKLNSLLHKTIKKVGEDIENFRFNTAISSLMILLNVMEKNSKTYELKNLKIFLNLLAPFAPHLSEELWRNILGNKKSIYLEKWPEYDPKLIAEEKFELVIQINGKVRDKILADSDISEEEAIKLAFSSEKIQKEISGKKIKKSLYIKGRLVSIVV